MKVSNLDKLCELEHMIHEYVNKEFSNDIKSATTEKDIYRQIVIDIINIVVGEFEQKRGHLLELRKTKNDYTLFESQLENECMLLHSLIDDFKFNFIKSEDINFYDISENTRNDIVEFIEDLNKRCDVVNK